MTRIPDFKSYDEEVEYYFDRFQKIQTEYQAAIAEKEAKRAIINQLEDISLKPFLLGLLDGLSSDQLRALLPSSDSL